MMKKVLMFCAVFMAGTAMMNAQFANIGIVGGSTSVGWSEANALAMTTTDGITYTYTGLVVTVPAQDGGVKFLQDNAWTTNWGASGFPNGTGTQNGANIPATNGTWNVTFNKTTGAYSFSLPGVVYDAVTLGGGTSAVTFNTADGIHYTAFDVALEAGAFYFAVNGAGQWGSTGFPTGTAVAGTTIPVTANHYNITFNNTTKAYAFNYVIISITGSAVGGWGTDTNMATTDGVNYSVNNVVFAADGEGNSEVKFRLNNEWDTAWGNGTFPSGTAEIVVDGGNIAVPAGTYNVTFNRESGAFAFTAPTAGITDVTLATATAYPNPAQTAWTINAGAAVISNVQITDLTGKVVLNLNANAGVVTVDATGFANGVYFARINAGQAGSIIKLVKN